MKSIHPLQVINYACLVLFCAAQLHTFRFAGIFTAAIFGTMIFYAIKVQEQANVAAKTAEQTRYAAFALKLMFGTWTEYTMYFDASPGEILGVGSWFWAGLVVVGLFITDIFSFIARATLAIEKALEKARIAEEERKAASEQAERDRLEREAKATREAATEIEKMRIQADTEKALEKARIRAEAKKTELETAQKIAEEQAETERNKAEQQRKATEAQENTRRTQIEAQRKREEAERNDREAERNRQEAQRKREEAERKQKEQAQREKEEKERAQIAEEQRKQKEEQDALRAKWRAQKANQAGKKTA